MSWLSKTSVVVLMGLVLVSSASADPPTDCVAYWRFNELVRDTAFDSIGDKDGILKEGPLWTKNGMVDGALSFDGYNDYVQLYDTFPYTGSFSVAAWVYPATDGNPEQYIIGTEDGGRGGNKGGWALVWLKNKFGLVMGNGKGSYVYPYTLIEHEKGYWYHVVGVWTPNHMRLHVNGGPDQLSPHGNFGSAEGTNARIGRYPNDNWGRQFKGKIDEVAIFNRALNQDEIEELYELSYSGNSYLPNGNGDPSDWWAVTGNADTDAGTHFLGTTDEEALELHVYSKRALRLEPNTTDEGVVSINVIGGYEGNNAKVVPEVPDDPDAPEVHGATISGGGTLEKPNRVTDHNGTIGGGFGNLAGNKDESPTNAVCATVGGGRKNKAQKSFATIAGGSKNTAVMLASTVGGGTKNHAGGRWSTVGGGQENRVHWKAAYGSIGGGRWNRIGPEASGPEDAPEEPLYATIAGGGPTDHSAPDNNNCNRVTGNYGTIGGGGGNLVGQPIGSEKLDPEKGKYATVPGGADNWALGQYSLAAGRRAKAKHNGSFVWADSNEKDFQSKADNEFAIRCTGGLRIVTAIDGDGVPTQGWQLLPNEFEWSPINSDRNLKENFAPTDCRSVLDYLAEVPISTWNYRAQDPSIRHMGPMAQDFYSVFGLGEDDRHISSVDADGVALAAIQGLYEIVQEKDVLLAEQQTEIDKLRARLEQLEAIVATQHEIQTGGAR